MNYVDRKADTDFCINVAAELRDRNIGREDLYVLYKLSGTEIQNIIEYIILSEYISEKFHVIKEDSDKILNRIIEDFYTSDINMSLIDFTVKNINTYKIHGKE